MFRGRRRVIAVAVCVAVTGAAALASGPAGASGGASGGQTALQATPGKSFALESTIPVGPGPERLTFGFGAVWTLNVINGSVTRVDATTGQARTIRVGPNVRDIRAGFNRIWVLRSTKTTATVVRLNPRNATRVGKNITIRLGTTQGAVNTLGITSGKVWVAGASTWRKLAYINPTSAEVTMSTFPLVAAFLTGNNSLWVVPPNGATIQRRNASNLKIEKTLHVFSFTEGEQPIELSFGAGFLWIRQTVPNDVGAIAKVDPSKGIVQSAINEDFDIRLTCAVPCLGSVWATEQFDASGFNPARVTRLSQTDLRQVGTQQSFPVGAPRRTRR